MTTLPIIDDTDADPVARLARAEGYELLGELLLYGARPDLLARAQLAEPFASRLLGVADDEVAAEHHRLFEREVFPYASVFLAPGSITGGAVAELARAAALETGVARATLDVSDDHLGALLVLLSRLGRAELDAEASGDPGRAVQCRVWAARVLADGVLSWVSVLRAALTREPDSLWTDVVVLAHELARAHTLELGDVAGAPVLPEPPAVLDDEKTRLRDLARFALTSCWAGVFLSGGAVAGVARGADLPTGFGSREQRLDGLLRSAADYGDPPAVLGALADAVARAAGDLRELSEDVDDATVRAFAARADETEAVLREAARRAAEVIAA